MTTTRGLVAALASGLVGLAVAGCGATLTGGVVTDPKAANPGARHRVPAPFEVSVYYLDEVDGGKKKVVRLALVKAIQMPDPRVLREVNYRGALLRSYDLAVELNANGTLSGVDLVATGAPQGGMVGESITQAIEAIRKSQDSTLKATEALEQENALLEARKRNRELKEELGMLP
jgi:hypothetical protein